MTGNIGDRDRGIESEQLTARDGRGTVSRPRWGVLRVGVFVCILVLAGSLLAGVAFAEDPIEISTWTELQAIEDDLSGDYVLIANLDKNTEGYDDVVGDGDFRPIGPIFTGSLDGNGHTISDLVISGGSDVGLFSTSEGDIHRLALKDVEIHGDDDRVGGIVGTMEGGKISESYVTGEVSGSAEIGGLMGRGTAGEVNASYTVVDVSVGVWRAGGLVGYVPSGTLYINESYAAGTLTGQRHGGVVGEVLSGTLNLESVYWDRERSGTSSTAGRVGSGTVSTNNVTGLSSDQMKGDAAETNMDGFDFADTWIAETGDIIFYPYLQSTPQDPASGREDSRFAGGLGTADDPLQIETWEHLHRVSESLDAHFELIGDLDKETDGYEKYVTDPSEGFEPIGDEADPFTGEFDGSGNVIDGLYIDQNEDHVGLFGSVGSTGRLTNVGLDAVDVTGNEYVGGLAGKSAGEIDQSWVSGNVTGSVTVGGLVGHTEGTVAESYAVGTVTGDSAVGGLVGSIGSSGDVSESYAASDVVADTEYGGLVGVNDGEVSSSFWNIDTVESGDGIGSNDGTFGATGLSTNEMKAEAAEDNMDGFDFDDSWTVETGDIISYPYLQSTPQDPVPGYDDTRFAGGFGTAVDPLQIATWEHLHNVREELDAHFELVDDIDDQTDGYSEYVANPSAGFEPIGDESDPFTGTFDGDGHEIRDLRIDRSEASNGKDAGLFLNVDGGVISAVGIVDGEITAADGNNGNAATDGADATDGESGGDAAGLVLVNDGGTVENSHVTNTTVTAGFGGAGGNGCSTFQQYNGCSGDDDGTLGSAGGDGGDGGDAAGVVLVSIDGTVNKTYLTGSTIAAGSGRNGGHGGDGGLSGGNGGNGGSAAGLIKYIDGEDAIIIDGYVDDTVITAGSGGRGGPGYDGAQSSPNPGAGGNGGAAAGIVSEIFDGTIENVYIFATNIDAGSGGSGGDGGTQHPNGSPGDDGSVGTIVVENGGTVSTSYWSTDTVNQNESDGGEGLTSAQMRGPNAEDNMVGFDFADSWTAGTNPEEGFLVSLPYLQQNQQVPAPGAQSLFADGNGTAENPYQIENWEHLYNVRQVLDANYTLSDDLDEGTVGYETYVANPTAGFEPIGDITNRFEGTFDGSERSISGLTITRDGENYVGLFGYVGDSGTLTKISLEAVDIEGSSRVGGLVGHNQGDITKSHASGSIVGDDLVGGLVGFNTGRIAESYTSGSVDSIERVGGLVGYNSGTGSSIEQSYATSSVNGSGAVGGVAGVNTGLITESYASGSLNGSGDPVGGIVGAGEGGTNSYWDIETTGQTESAGNGIGLTTLQMTGDRAADNMFDFGETWAAGEADSQADGLTVFYPVLQNNTQEPAPSTSLYDTGEGTVDNPYEIGDWYQLNYIRVSLDAHFALTDDLDEETPGYEQVAGPDANGGKGFDPIGDDVEPFTGTFDGNGHSISDLTIMRGDESSVGLFGSVSAGGELTAVRLEAVDVEGSSRVGGLVGSNAGDITDSYVIGSVEGADDGEFVGGLVGENGGTITESFASGSVTGSTNVGGLVGMNGDQINQSHASGSVTGSTNVGGLVGQNQHGGTITESYAISSAEGSINVGGFVGLNGGHVTTSYSTGSVDGDETVGGFVGENAGDIATSYASGTTNGTADVGGLVGANSGDITESYATGSVDGDVAVGGLVGANQIAEKGVNEGHITASYASGSVDGTDDVGGLVGLGNDDTVADSYWDTEATGQDASDGGIGLTTIEMKGLGAEMNMFDFVDTWAVVADQDVSYPYLQAIPQDPAPGLESIESVTLSLESDVIEQGEETFAIVEVELSESGTLDATSVSTFESSNEDNATVGEDGTINGTGVGTLEITGTYGAESDTQSLEVTPGPAVSVEVETEPDGTQTAGDPITGPPAVLVTDEFGNPIPEINVSITTVNEAGPIVSGEMKIETESDGIATFDDLVIENATDGYSLEFSIDENDEGVDEDDTATTEPFTVEPNVVDRVEIDPDASLTITAGESIEFDVEAFDEYDNLNASDPADFDWTDAPEGTFDNATAGNYEVTATIDGVTSDTVAVTVEPGPADSIAVETEPEESQTAGEEITDSPSVVATDEFGNSVPDVFVTVSAVDGDGGVESGDIDNSTNAVGTATFDGLVIEVADDYRLEFSIDDADATVSTANSTTTRQFTVEPNVVDNVVIDHAGTETITAGETIEFDIEAFDEYDNLNTSDPVDFAWTNATEGTFDNTTTGTYEVTATLDSVTSDPITVTVEPGPVTVVETDPDDARTITAGETIEFNATALDDFDNLVEDTDSAFTWANTTDDGTFNDTTAGNYSVNATLDGVTSDAVSVTVEPGDPYALRAGTVSRTAGDSGEVRPRLEDEFGNAIPDEPITITADDGLDVATGSSTTTDDGVAVFGFEETEAGRYTVAVEVDSTPTVNTTTTVRVRPASPRTVGISPDDNRTITAGDTIDFSAVAHDRYGNLVTNTNDDFDWQYASESGAFTHTTAGEYAVQATISSVSSAEVLVTVEPGAIDSIVIDPGEYQTIDAGAQIRFTATAFDAYDNVVTADDEAFTWANASTDGTFEQTSVGTFTVTASADGVVSNPVAVQTQTRVSVDDGDQGETAVTVEYPVAGETVVIDRSGTTVGEPLSGQGNVLVEQMQIHVETDRDFWMDITAFDRDLSTDLDADDLDPEVRSAIEAAADAYETGLGLLSTGYVNVDHNLGPDDLSGATVEFSIEQSYLDELGIDPDAVTVYRTGADGWDDQETSHVNTSDSFYHFEANVEGFSVLVLGSDEPRMTVTDTSLEGTHLSPEETATVTATVENRGLYPGEHTFVLLANGAEVASETVLVEAHASTTISLEFTPSEAGTFDLTVDGIEVGTVTVKSASESTDEDTAAGVSNPGSNSSWFPFAVFVLLTAVLVGLGVWHRRGRPSSGEDDGSPDGDEPERPAEDHVPTEPSHVDTVRADHEGDSDEFDSDGFDSDERGLDETDSDGQDVDGADSTASHEQQPGEVTDDGLTEWEGSAPDGDGVEAVDPDREPEDSS